MKPVIIIAIAFVLLISLSVFAQSSSQVFASHDKLLKWKLAFITESGDCDAINTEAMFWFQRVTEIYLNRYQVNQEMRDLDCINHYKIQDEDFSFEDYDLIIYAPVLSLRGEYIDVEKWHGMYQWENNENTIVSSALNYKIYSDDYTWTLSHELSHFVLNWKGYPWDVVGGDVHKIHDEYMDCKKIDRTLSICPQLWEIITTTDRDEMKIMKVITTEDYQPEKSIPEKTTPKETTPFSKIGIRFGVAVMDETTKGTIKVFPSLKDARGNLISHPDIYVWIDGENKGWIEPNKWSKSFLANQGSHKIDVATTKFQYAGNFYQSIEATNTMYAEERHIAEESGFSAGVFSGSGGVVTFDSDDSDKKNLYAEPKFITLYINDWGDNQGYLLDDGTVEFIGSVSDEKGNFVSDVEIIIEDMFNQGIVIPTTTDDQGNFFVKWTPVYPEHWTQVLENMEVFQAYVKNNMIINSDNLFILSIINEEESAEEPIETIEESVETIEKPVETIEKHVEEPEPKFCFLWWCWY